MDKRAVVLLAQEIFRSYGELSGEAVDRAMAQAKKQCGITDEYEEVREVQGNQVIIKYVLKNKECYEKKEI